LQSDYKIIKADEPLVALFIAKLKKGASFFRYYARRPISIINNHLVTLVLISEENIPLAYGHLEKENNIVWLGIAVADSYQNKGLGKIMLSHLIETARFKLENTISLSVDKNNYIAQKLYRSFGFVQTSDLPAQLIFELKLN
jgi:GNAT superfamily N-acetyltransferase